jgi:hypothetical protein
MLLEQSGLRVCLQCMDLQVESRCWNSLHCILAVCTVYIICLNIHFLSKGIVKLKQAVQPAYPTIIIIRNTAAH